MFTTCMLHAFYLKLKFVYFKFDKISHIDMVFVMQLTQSNAAKSYGIGNIA